MRNIFVSLYDILRDRKPMLITLWVLMLLGCGFFANRLELRESIQDMLPHAEQTEGLHTFLKQGQIADRILVMVCNPDTSDESQIQIASVMDSIAADLEVDAGNYISALEWRTNDSLMEGIIAAVKDHLPVFLEERDYAAMDSMLQEPAIRNRILENYKLLSGPAGYGVKSFILEDPLLIRNLAYQKFLSFQAEEAVIVKDGYFFSGRDNCGLIFIQPTYSSSETKQNIGFQMVLEGILSKYTSSSISVDYFGAPFVAAGNASQIRTDMIITVSLMVLLLLAVLWIYFRIRYAPLLVLIPVCMGAIFGMAGMYLFKGSISIIALGAGSLILGIAVNYSLHFLTDYKFHPNVREVIGNLSFPLTMGSLTTVAGFFSLRWVHAGVLQDLGMFAACSLVGAALTTLIFLPHLIPQTKNKGKRDFKIPSFFSTLIPPTKYRFLLIVLLTPVLFYFAKKVGFEADLNKLNYIDTELAEAERKAKSLSPQFNRSVFVLSKGVYVDDALMEAEQVNEILSKIDGATSGSSVVSVLPSTMVQENRIARWKAFWAGKSVDSILDQLVESGHRVGFNAEVFDAFKDIVQKPYRVLNNQDPGVLSKITQPFIHKDENGYTVMQILHSDGDQLPDVNDALASHPNTLVFDRQGVTQQLMEWVRKDFSFITWVTSILVFVSLLLIYGRIELAILSFLPMVISWIWILGIMGIFKIQFNMVNVILSTFIFALGDDFCIFTNDGLQKKYSYGREQTKSVSTSIALSAITTMIGLGVLIFARHPALRSIAGVSLIGIGSVWFISQTIQPALYNYFIIRPAKAKHRPFTFLGIAKSVFAFTYFFVTSIITGLIGFIALKIIPGNNPTRQYRYHQLLSASNWSLIHIMFNLKKNIIGKSNETYKTPSVIIANHSSFLDILLVTMLHPRTILLTNEWTWNSPVFGLAIRLAEYYPVRAGIEEIIPQLKDKVERGYSIAIFPEGTRSVTGDVQRFHKGAFYIAEALDLDIQPMIIHNANEMMMKGFFYLNDGQLSVKFLPRIAANDDSFGTTLREKAKNYRRYVELEKDKMDEEILTPDDWKKKLISNYIYKGPFLEWYLRIKIRLEQNYKLLDTIIPSDAQIVDLGCGYGFLAYMLMLNSRQRQVLGVDYDEDKIAIAQNGYLNNSRIEFLHADITRYAVPEADVIILSDVLHYLTDVQKNDVCDSAIRSIRPGGMLIIREGVINERNRHKKTEFSEWLSTKLLRFNKVAETDLKFVSDDWFSNLASRHGVHFDRIEDSKLTSNTIFVFYF